MPRVVMLASCVVLPALSACAKTVHVVDPHGAPLEDARVITVSPSLHSAPNMTDENGEAPLPRLFVWDYITTIQQPRWVRVEKPGFKECWLEVPETWPLHVTLAPEDLDGSKQ